jgi:hypothetical protein
MFPAQPPLDSQMSVMPVSFVLLSLHVPPLPGFSIGIFRFARGGALCSEEWKLTYPSAKSQYLLHYYLQGVRHTLTVFDRLRRLCRCG